MLKVRRALLSVWDKIGIVDFARGLHHFGIEIISTGGTARLLKNAHVPVVEVSQYTGFPEMLDGRIKTLHPFIHGGILALRSKKEHMDEIKGHHIGLIDMVVVNLYPFERVTQKKNVTLKEAVENIDIGGPAMLRSAAKNFRYVAVISNPERYREILKELDTNSGMLSDRVLINLALEAFEHTVRYDSVIYDFLNNRLKKGELLSFPRELVLRFVKIQDLRYGENPHQGAAFYQMAGCNSGFSQFRQRHGKELSFNNILDLNTAVNILKDFKEPTAVIIKHGNPTGVACHSSLADAYEEAYRCDPLSAFGGIIGFNREVDQQTAKGISQSGFMECVIAPGFGKSAFKLLSQKKNIRLVELKLDETKTDDFDFKRVSGGLLYQEEDKKEIQPNDLKVVTKIRPSPQQTKSLLFGWKVVKHVKSNAIVLTKGTRTVGIGCGQTSRVVAAQIAIEKAARNAPNALLASDAFLPKVDTVEIAAKAGIKAIIQTGGSIADDKIIKAADKAKIAMIFTGVRHFKH